MEYLNRWAYVYVGIYGYSFTRAGRAVSQLFHQRGFTALINDDLVRIVVRLAAIGVGGFALVSAPFLVERWLTVLRASMPRAGLRLLRGCYRRAERRAHVPSQHEYVHNRLVLLHVDLTAFHVNCSDRGALGLSGRLQRRTHAARRPQQLRRHHLRVLRRGKCGCRLKGALRRVCSHLCLAELPRTRFRSSALTPSCTTNWRRAGTPSTPTSWCRPDTGTLACSHL
jgi:hypothetical protein